MPAPVSVASAALQAHLASLLRLDRGMQAAGSSLAQRLGLVPGYADRKPLTPEGWLAVHQQSQARGDSAGDCAICLRPFRAEGQVLLSCSHTFHHHCLASLERFARQYGRGGACCPLCRAAAYEKKRIDDAEKLWRHTCAARIQAAWRGLLARRAYRALRRLLPPAHPALRRRWAAEALGETSAPLVDSVHSGAAEVDALFAELDANAAAAGAVFRELSSRCQQPASETGGPAASAAAAAAGAEAPTAGDSPEAAPAAARRSPAAGVARLPCEGASSKAGARALQEHDWEAIIERCLQRDEQPECAICLASLGQLCSRTSGSGGGGGRGKGSVRHSKGSAGGAAPHRDAQPGGMSIAVLSCSHAFHADCLSSFEAFALASELAPACPCCRSAYARMDLC